MRNIAKCLLGTVLFYSSFAVAAKYNKIYVVGADSLGKDSVLHYSKLKTSQDITSVEIRQAIISLHKTGLFSDINIRTKAGNLIIYVVEMPVLSKVNFKGTDHISKKQFLAALKAQGVAVGKVFNPKVVYQIKPMLLQALSSLGYEHAKIQVRQKVKSKSVELSVSIDEGADLLVKEIDFIGNNLVADRLLFSKMEIAPRVWSFISSNNKFSNYAINNDLKSIQKYYQSLGYLQARAELVKTISLDDGVKLVIKITEGKKFLVDSIALKGFVAHDFKAITNKLNVGGAYDINQIESIRKQLKNELGSLGYAFAEVNFLPKLVNDKRVKIVFMAKLGEKVHIRHVNFVGQTLTKDEVFRRELRQTELGLYNLSQIRESERRIRNLSFIKSVKCSPHKYVGYVDLDCDIKEMPSANYIASLGYSPQSGITYKIDVNQKNLAGTGKRLLLNLEKSDIQTSGRLSMTQPYIFGTDYSNTWSVDAVKLKNVKKDSAKYQSDHFGVYNDFSLPIDDFSRFQMGIGLQNLTILKYDENTNYIKNFIDAHGKHFGILDAHFSFAYNNYDRYSFPRSGSSKRLSFLTTLPLKDTTLRFYQLDFSNSTYIPLGHEFTLNWLFQLGYGKGYGGDSYPFFKNYWAGGEGSVRGFETHSLGPKDQNGKSMGANLLAASSLNLYMPQSLGEDIRYGVFLDAGNVFQDSIDLKEIRASYGAVVQWHTPMAPMTFAFGLPLSKKKEDKLESFSVSLSSDF